MNCSRRLTFWPALRLCTCAATLFAAAPSFGVTTYKFDIDRTESLVTMPGWTSFPVGNADTTVTHVVDGIDFRLSSADGARLRGTVAAPVPDALLADFAFDDGAGQAIIFHFGTAGQLPANIWQVDVYSLDSGGGIAVEDQILGLRRNGAETEIANNVIETDMGPAYSFRFRSDGVSAYDIFLRENNVDNRTRLNAVVLSTIPEPGTIALVGLAGVALVGYRRLRK
jgi:hypothetical protein